MHLKQSRSFRKFQSKKQNIDMLMDSIIIQFERQQKFEHNTSATRRNYSTSMYDSIHISFILNKK